MCRRAKTSTEIRRKQGGEKKGVESSSKAENRKKMDYGRKKRNKINRDCGSCVMTGTGVSGQIQAPAAAVN